MRDFSNNHIMAKEKIDVKATFKAWNLKTKRIKDDR